MSRRENAFERIRNSEFAASFRETFQNMRKESIANMHKRHTFLFTYCFASIPFFAGGQRDQAIEIFNELTCWNDVSVLQDDLKEPYNHVPFLMDKGLVCLLDSVLSHTEGLSSDYDELPFGVWATRQQLMTVLNDVYSNNSKMSKYYKAGTLSFHEGTNKF